jgi:ribokinase
MDVGGKGLNQAVAARRAGAEVRLVAPVGRDEPARHIRDVAAAGNLGPADTLLMQGNLPLETITGCLDAARGSVWAIRAASLKVTRHGTIAGFPTAAEVAALRQP